MTFTYLKTTVLLKPFFFAISFPNLPFSIGVWVHVSFFFFFFLYHFLGTIATLESKVANLTGQVNEIRLPIPPGKINK